MSRRTSTTFSFYSTKTLARHNISRVGTEDVAEAIIVIPQDSWYSWVVNFATFVICFMTDGGLYAFSIFLEDVSRTLEIPLTTVAIANSLMTGLNFGLGPVTCALVNKYGFRLTSIFGGLIMAAAFFGASFTTNVYVFLIITGVVGGAASCVHYTPALIICGFYFEKWRALAACITACGSSFGIVAFPPVFSSMLKNETWQTKFRILAGCYIFCCFLALAFKPVPSVKLTDQKGQVSIYSIFSTTMDAVDQRRSYRRNRQYPTVSDANFGKSPMYRRDLYGDDQSIFGDYGRGHASLTTLVHHGSIYTEALSTRYTAMEDYDDTEDEEVQKLNCCQKCSKCCNKKQHHNFLDLINRPMYRDDVFYASTIYYLPQYKEIHDFSPETDKKLISVAYHMSVTRLTTLKDVQEQHACVCCPEAVKRVVATMMDYELLKLPSFILLSASGVFTVFAVFPSFIFIMERAIGMNISHTNAIFLVSILGISNLIGRILCGVMSLFPLNATVFVWIFLIISGGSLIISNYFNTYVGQIVCAAIFGSSIAVFFALRTIMLVELYGLQNLTNAFGLNLMFQGLASFAGVPLASELQKKTGSFNASYLMLGSSITLSGILLIPVSALAKIERRNKKIPNYIVPFDFR